jgi:hypothetical protein
MRSLFSTALAGLLALASGLGCAKPAPPAVGERIQPVLDKPLAWKAGEPANLSIRLQASNPENGSVRPLDFPGLPETVNPAAKITFFAGAQELKSTTVTLSHRC